MDISIRECGSDQLDPILEIINEVILNSTALYDYQPRSIQKMEEWFENKRMNQYPVIGAFDPDHQLCGFGSYGPFRNWPAYKYTVEHSVYVKSSSRGMGIGKLLLQSLVKAAQSQNYHNMIGGIDSMNQASVKLHLDAGFEYCGCIRHAGFKFGRWLDLSFYQLILPTPIQPSDG